MEYCYDVWSGAPSCYLEMLDKLQKQMFRLVALSLAASLEPLDHCQNLASLSLFHRCYIDRCSSELDVHLNLLKWFHFLFLNGGQLVILIDCIISLSPFQDILRVSMFQFLSLYS